jgi:hypothetical protein
MEYNLQTSKIYSLFRPHWYQRTDCILKTMFIIAAASVLQAYPGNLPRLQVERLRRYVGVPPPPPSGGGDGSPKNCIFLSVFSQVQNYQMNIIIIK